VAERDDRLDVVRLDGVGAQQKLDGVLDPLGLVERARGLHLRVEALRVLPRALRRLLGLRPQPLLIGHGVRGQLPARLGRARRDGRAVVRPRREPEAEEQPEADADEREEDCVFVHRDK
jgi:hypothetical protein